MGFDAVASWGACVYDPYPIDEDVVSFCDSFGKSYGDKCASIWSLSYMSRVEDCEDYGGTWVFPSTSKAECDAAGVCSK